VTSAGGAKSALDRRLGSLAHRHTLPAESVAKLRRFLVLLVDDPLAPTAIRHPLDVIDHHLADSLVALELEPVLRASTALDLGSGAGVPGIPLAVARPDTTWWLLESSARKCAFLERAVSACGVSNAHVVHARAESFSEGRGRHELVTARAVAKLVVTAEYAAPLLRVGGALVAWGGRRSRPDEAAAAQAGRELGLEGPETLRVEPFSEAEHRHLHLMSKVRETPSRFPRRPGAALKRPLGPSPRATISSDRCQR
jgi:16S rRNA (guanine527-N7)-methyltransferase